jgi:hypothetical protein
MRHPVRVNALKFIYSDKFGDRYKNNIFIGNYNAGQLYFFKVNEKRDGLMLDGALADGIADDYEESLEARVGLFGREIVDLQTRSDGKPLCASVYGQDIQDLN